MPRPFKNTSINRDHANGQWKGDDVGYAALHEWVRNRLPKPKACQDCGEIKRLDLANISQEYKRDLSDWEWLCRRCHMTKDGRGERLRFTRPHTEESRQKISASLQQYCASTTKRQRYWLGKKMPQEMIQNMQLAAKARLRDEKGRFIPKQK